MALQKLNSFHSGIEAQQQYLLNQESHPHAKGLPAQANRNGQPGNPPDKATSGLTPSLKVNGKDKVEISAQARKLSQIDPQEMAQLKQSARKGFAGGQPPSALVAARRNRLQAGYGNEFAGVPLTTNAGMLARGDHPHEIFQPIGRVNNTAARQEAASSESGGDPGVAENGDAGNAVENEAEPSAPEKQDLADTASLGDVEISDIRETGYGDDGQVTSATGTIDLSEYGLGEVAVDLEMENGEIVGATSRQDTLTVNAGEEQGVSLTIGNEDGDLLSVDSEGGVNISGQASLDIAGQGSVDIGQASISLQENGFELTAETGEGEAATTVTVTDDTFSIDASRDFVGGVISSVAGEAMGGAFETLTGFMESAGLSGDTGGSDFSLEIGSEGFQFTAFGISGSFGTNDEGDQQIAAGGFGLGAGLSVEVENVSVDASGELSASISAGVGASIGGMGVGFDLGGFEVGYDSETGDISLGGAIGNDFMNVQASITLTRDSAGNYGIGSTSFSANVDDAAAEEMAAGLNSAYDQGVELGSQAYEQASQLTRETAEKFGRELQNVGAGMEDFLSETGDVLANYGEEQLNNALDFGTEGVEALSRHGQQVFDAAAKLGNEAGNAVGELADSAAGTGKDALEGFINNEIISGTGELVEQNGELMLRTSEEFIDWLNPFNWVKKIQTSFTSLENL
jgi:hypothetical protein